MALLSISKLLARLNEVDESHEIEAKRSEAEVGKSALETISAFANEPGLMERKGKSVATHYVLGHSVSDHQIAASQGEVVDRPNLSSYRPNLASDRPNLSSDRPNLSSDRHPENPNHPAQAYRAAQGLLLPNDVASRKGER